MTALRWYAALIAKQPRAFALCGVALIIVLTVIGGTIGGLPNFGDAAAGFEPRGTVVKARLFAHEHLRNATKTCEGYKHARDVPPNCMTLVQRPSSAPPAEPSRRLFKRLAHVPSDARALHEGVTNMMCSSHDQVMRTRPRGLLAVFEAGPAADPQRGLFTAAALKGICNIGTRFAARSDFRAVCKQAPSAWRDDRDKARLGNYTRGYVVRGRRGVIARSHARAVTGAGSCSVDRLLAPGWSGCCTAAQPLHLLHPRRAALSHHY